MATTPEGRIKSEVRAALHENGVHPFVEVATGKVRNVAGTYYMPTAGPFSVHGIHDFVGCWRGVFFSIETKAPNNPEDETVHQGYFRAAVTEAGGVSLTGVRDGAAAVAAIRAAVESIKLDELEKRFGREPV